LPRRKKQSLSRDDVDRVELALGELRERESPFYKFFTPYSFSAQLSFTGDVCTVLAGE